jgi:hypothetical protein
MRKRGIEAIEDYLGIMLAVRSACGASYPRCS